jgi:teichuronic acid biosynthesis glycosyltransferase TuaC
MSLAARYPRLEVEPKLHVMTLTPFYPSDNDDATGCFVSEPLGELAKVGIRNTVFAVQPFYRKKSRASALAPGAHWWRYPALPRGFGLPSAGAFLFARIVGHVRKMHASNRIDLVHAHSALPCGHAALLLNRELGIPYVVSVHGLDAFSTVQVAGKPGEWGRRISRRVYISSRRVICISERVREQVIEGVGGKCRTSVVPNGVDPALFHPNSTPSSDSLTILSVGTLIPIKGHEVLIRAFAALAQEFSALNLQIIGDGPERHRLQALARQLGVFDRVQFLGRRSRRQVAEAMQRCTLFALPSRFEGLGCVYLEAMSMGKAVVGCRGQAISEIIRHGFNGFLVGPDNVRELTLALAMLLREPNLRRNLGTAAQDTIRDRLTLAHQAGNLARIYRESVA